MKKKKRKKNTNKHFKPETSIRKNISSTPLPKDTLISSHVPVVSDSQKWVKPLLDLGFDGKPDLEFNKWIKPFVELGFSIEPDSAFNPATNQDEDCASCLLELASEDSLHVFRYKLEFAAILSGSVNQDGPYIEMGATAPSPMEAANQVLRNAWKAGGDKRSLAALFASFPHNPDSVNDIVIAGAGRFTIADLDQVKSIFSIRSSCFYDEED